MLNKIWLILLLLTLPLAAGPSFAHTNAQTGAANAHPPGLLPLVGGANLQGTNSTASGPTWDEQLGESFTQDFTSLAFNVTAVPQSDSYGYGPAYLLNGLSDTGYWYQVGLSYNWPYYQASGYYSGFNMNYEVFNPSDSSIFPTNGEGGLVRFSGPVNSGDLVLLNLYFDNSTGVVKMYAYDWNTGASASESFSSEGATYFQGQNGYSTSNSNGFFTGLMTEWYHTNPYYGSEQQVTYSEQGFQFTSAWLWVDEYNTNTQQTLFSTSTSTPVSLTSQLYPYSSNGAVEYASSNEFITGPIAFNLTYFSSGSVTADQGSPAGISFTSDVIGGIPPYNYYLYVDGAQVNNVSTSLPNFEHTFYLHNLAVGQHTFYIVITDSAGSRFTSSTYGITVNPDPAISISVPSNAYDVGQTLTVSASTSQGTPPYSIAYYLDGNLMNGNTVTLDNPGSYQVTARLTDSLGYQVGSSTISVAVNPDPSMNGTYSLGSSSFLYSNDIATLDAAMNGGTSPYTYTWYLNGEEVATTTSATYTYRLANMGQNVLNVTATDATGYSVQASLAVNYTYNYTNIAIIVIVIAAVITGAALALRRRGNRKGPVTQQPENRPETPSQPESKPEAKPEAPPPGVYSFGMSMAFSLELKSDVGDFARILAFHVLGKGYADRQGMR
ncbi:MAG: hypothetical protein JRM78_05445 [Nitrososphaerota archaeon]|nr:hypothetical protein [Nitrososphaerota archaeon]